MMDIVHYVAIAAAVILLHTPLITILHINNFYAPDVLHAYFIHYNYIYMFVLCTYVAFYEP